MSSAKMFTSMQNLIRNWNIKYQARTFDTSKNLNILCFFSVKMFHSISKASAQEYLKKKEQKKLRGEWVGGVFEQIQKAKAWTVPK